jgi:hypothetical protein
MNGTARDPTSRLFVAQEQIATVFLIRGSSHQYAGGHYEGLDAANPVDHQLFV